MVDLIDLLCGQVTRHSQAFSHFEGFVVVAHEEVALHAAFQRFQSLQRFLCNARKSFVTLACILIVPLFILNTSHLEQRVVGIIVIRLRQNIIKVRDDLFFCSNLLGTLKGIIMSFQQIGTSLEIVEIILQSCLSLLVTAIKIEEFSVGEGK